MFETETIVKNLALVKKAISNALNTSSRIEKTTELVAVSKTRDVAVIEKTLIAGQCIFGENRVQEAEMKWPELKEAYPNTQLHLIGPLQTNKAALAVRLFDVIETIDRLKLARAISRQIKETERRVRCFVQVNTGKETQKAGVFPEEADAFIKTCRLDLDLPIDGLMCIPPKNEAPAPHFGLLREIGDRNEIKELSMGMSADYEIAIQFGATYVRVGTAIFGPRNDQSSGQTTF